MKKLKVSITALALLLGTTLMAQPSGTGEIAFGYGGVSSNAMGVVMFDIVSTVGAEILGSSYSRENYKNIGTGRFSLKLTPHDRFTIGGALIYEHIDSDLEVGGQLMGHQRLTFYTAALEFDYRYVSKEKFQMYFSLGAGTTFMHENFLPDETLNSQISSFNDFYDPYLNLHVNLLGLRFGKTVGVFVELGLGYKGIANAGISFQPQPLDRPHPQPLTE